VGVFTTLLAGGLQSKKGEGKLRFYLVSAKAAGGRKLTEEGWRGIMMRQIGRGLLPRSYLEGIGGGGKIR